MRLRSFLSNTQSLAILEYSIKQFHHHWFGLASCYHTPFLKFLIFSFWLMEENTLSYSNSMYVIFFSKKKMPHNILKLTLIADSRLPSKCDFSFCVFLSILWISQSIITQIKWSCTIWNCRRKGLFENVQNFLWQCFLNREIAETKVERVLRDTLYIL